MGGNKSRQLEYLLGEALDQGADTIIHGGAIQSNYCRQLAAACAGLGLRCELVLSTAYGQPLNQGGHLLDRLLGARITLINEPLGQVHEQLKAELRDRLCEQGRRPFLITYPQSEVLGSLGYVTAAIELVQQFQALTPPDFIVTPAVGATYAGLLLGLHLLDLPIPVIGFAPLRQEYDVAGSVRAAMEGAASRLGLEVPSGTLAAVDIRYTQVGRGYAIPTEGGLHALRDVARLQGVLLDPVYTSKAAAGLRTLLHAGRTAMFVHTGGAPALFAYAEQLAAHLEAMTGDRG
jgi:1-aminocyclopropane-1-carboxylate deaminase/D-cysteine desulfhydrase-like pyridoxal-dependent ACC family enzyme